MNFKKILLFIFLLILSAGIFAQNEKADPKTEHSANDPTVFFMVIYSNKQPIIMNISYDRDVDDKFLSEKLNLFKKNFKGELTVLPNEKGEKNSVNILISKCDYKVGEGETLEPFINSFYEEKKIVVMFAGDFEPCENPILVYEKNDLDITGHVGENSIDYTIKPGGDKAKLPHSQKEIDLEKAAKKLAKIGLWSAIALLIIIIFALMMKNSLRKAKKRRLKK